MDRITQFDEDILYYQQSGLGECLWQREKGRGGRAYFGKY